MAIGGKGVYHADVVSVQKDLGKFGGRAGVVTGVVRQSHVEGFVSCEWRTIQSHLREPCLETCR